MTAEEAGWIMMSGGGEPVIQPLSVEGINALQTIATAAVGNFVWEFKEPQKYYAGSMNVTTSSKGNPSGYSSDIRWYVPVILNGVFASFAEIGGNATDYHARYRKVWDDESDTGKCVRTDSCYNFCINAIKFTNSSSNLPSIDVSLSFDIKKEMTDEQTTYRHETGNVGFYFRSSTDPKLTDLSSDEYYMLVSEYLQAQKGNTPVIDIPQNPEQR